jgi:hypothetical protein
VLCPATGKLWVSDFYLGTDEDWFDITTRQIHHSYYGNLKRK